MASEHVKPVIDEEWHLGPTNPVNTGALPGYGYKLYLSGGPAGATYNSENSDPLWVARYNVATDESELHLNIGDGDGGSGGVAVDALEIGLTRGGTWYPKLRIQSNGTIIFMKNAEPADAELSASQFALWLDDTPGTSLLMIKAKDSGGTVVTGSVALA